MADNYMKKELDFYSYSNSQVKDVLEFVRSISSTFEWNEIVETIVKRTVDLFEGDNGTLFIYDQKAEHLIPEYALGFNWEYLRELKLKPGEALSGKVFLKKDLILYRDEREVVSALEGLNHAQRHNTVNAFVQRNTNFQSSMCAPLIWKENCLGVLAIHNVSSRYKFNEHDLQLLGYVANHAAVALGNSLLYNQQRAHSEKLEEYVQINERITSMVLNGGGLNRIAVELSGLLSRPVHIFDPFLTCIAATETSYDSVQLSEKDVNMIRDRKGPVILTNENTEDYKVATAISVEGSILGYLLVTTFPYYSLDKEDLTTIERVTMIVGLEMMKTKVSLETEKRMRGNLFHQISLGEVSHNTGQLLSMLGYDPMQSYVCLVCSIGEKSVMEKQNNTSEERIAKFFKLQEGVLVFPYQESFTVLLPMGKNQEANVKNHTFVENKVDAFIANLEKYTDINFMVGVGRLFNKVNDLPVSYREAGKTLTLLKKHGRAERIWTYRKLGPLRFLLQVASEQDLNHYMQEVLGVMIDENSPSSLKLLETLVAWMNNGRNSKKTSEALSVHINTVIYRLQRVEEILNISFQNEDDWMTVQLAVRLWETLTGKSHLKKYVVGFGDR
jgi:sugar diacid utilization regulator